MAKDHGPSIKDDRLYEELREDGASKEKAARIANAKAGGEDVSQKGGEAEDYEDRTKEELEDRARGDRHRGPFGDVEGRADRRPTEPLTQ